VKDCITLAVKNVFSRMIRKNAVLVVPGSWPARPEDPDVQQYSSRVAFRGSINGAVTLSFTEGFVKESALACLGISSNKLSMRGDALLRDFVGEVANMTVGNFKNILCDLGHPCVLTLPIVHTGCRLQVTPIPTADCYTYEFDCEFERLKTHIEILPT
jgi:chemotaxis protein CheX